MAAFNVLYSAQDCIASLHFCGGTCVRRHSSATISLSTPVRSAAFSMAMLSLFGLRPATINAVSSTLPFLVTARSFTPLKAMGLSLEDLGCLVQEVGDGLQLARGVPRHELPDCLRHRCKEQFELAIAS